MRRVKRYLAYLAAAFAVIYATATALAITPWRAACGLLAVLAVGAVLVAGIGVSLAMALESRRREEDDGPDGDEEEIDEPAGIASHVVPAAQVSDDDLLRCVIARFYRCLPTLSPDERAAHEVSIAYWRSKLGQGLDGAERAAILRWLARQPEVVS